MIPEEWLVGRRGQSLAAGLLCLVLALIWFGLVDPVRSWYADREAILDQRQALLFRMRDVATTLPGLQAASANRHGEGDQAATMMLPGTTDAVAAADLQERVQKMAAFAGVNLTAVETLPATPSGRWRKVPLRISLNAPWPVLMDLLRTIETSETRILVDDVHFHSPAVAARLTVLPIQASMVVYGFRPAEAGAGS